MGILIALITMQKCNGGPQQLLQIEYVPHGGSFHLILNLRRERERERNLFQSKLYIYETGKNVDFLF